MNLFEDLVDELKEANLLEDTVMDAPKKRGAVDPSHEDRSAYDQTESPADPAARNFASPIPVADSDTVQSADIQFQGNGETIEIREANSESEFFRKRAVSEISSLKMVEAVLSAVEREQLKAVPNSYDDLEANTALHAFLKVSEDITGDEHKHAEFKLLHETESWCSALAARDKNLTVANLRRYCETCRPMLSSQAMLAIARFYRNLPYSETVRGKFDFIITRLFSRPMDDETRKLLFDSTEVLSHVKTLYADWSSIPLYSADDDESKMLLAALSFEELSVEAESSPTFDELIKSDFFGRLRLFKESIAELFFAPVVTAAAIECNIRVGNIYVKLINLERSKMDSASIHNRFGDLNDQTVSEAAGQTLELVEILRERTNTPIGEEDLVEDEVVGDEEPDAASVVKTPKPNKSKSVDDEGTFIERLTENAFQVNKVFLAVAILLVVTSIGLYVWASYFAEPTVSSAGVKTLSFQGTDLGENVKTAKLSGDTLYILSLPTVDTMTKDKQAELLQKLYTAGKDKGWVNVNLMNSEGRTIGFASLTRMEITATQ